VCALVVASTSRYSASALVAALCIFNGVAVVAMARATTVGLLQAVLKPMQPQAVGVKVLSYTQGVAPMGRDAHVLLLWLSRFAA
jgi:hypothetical protein